MGPWKRAMECARAYWHCYRKGMPLYETQAVTQMHMDIVDGFFKDESDIDRFYGSRFNRDINNSIKERTKSNFFGALDEATRLSESKVHRHRIFNLYKELYHDMFGKAYQPSDKPTLGQQMPRLQVKGKR